MECVLCALQCSWVNVTSEFCEYIAYFMMNTDFMPHSADSG